MAESTNPLFPLDTDLVLDSPLDTTEDINEFIRNFSALEDGEIDDDSPSKKRSNSSEGKARKALASRDGGEHSGGGGGRGHMEPDGVVDGNQNQLLSHGVGGGGKNLNKMLQLYEEENPNN